jgi:hypothetical protein
MGLAVANQNLVRKLMVTIFSRKQAGIFIPSDMNRFCGTQNIKLKILAEHIVILNS